MPWCLVDATERNLKTKSSTYRMTRPYAGSWDKGARREKEAGGYYEEHKRLFTYMRSFYKGIGVCLDRLEANFAAPDFPLARYGKELESLSAKLYRTSKDYRKCAEKIGRLRDPREVSRPGQL